jgi:hypothetical protein
LKYRINVIKEMMQSEDNPVSDAAIRFRLAEKYGINIS